VSSDGDLGRASSKGLMLTSEMKDKRAAGVFGMSTAFRFSGDTARQQGIRLMTMAGHDEGSQNNGPDCLPGLV
jgi:hypothetical protein